MKEFITIWPTIEGSVSTTNPSLYTRVESESPVIMVKGSEKEYQEKLEKLIADLSQIDTSARYNAFDAMLILLREGVEALLIVMALVTTLKAAKLRKGSSGFMVVLSQESWQVWLLLSSCKLLFQQ